MHDVAVEMKQRGHRVIVVTSNRGYDDPSIRYPGREIRDGVEIRRVSFSSFGKSSFALRVLGAVLFTLQAIVHGLLAPNIGCVVVSTAPPLCGTAALAIRLLRGIPFVYWVMDLNPDQLIALESLKASSRAAWFLESVNRMILSCSAQVIALDRFMAARLESKVQIGERLRVVPPWPHEKYLGPVPHAENPFRQQHGLQGKFVFMYSGNHSSSNPLRTLLDAAVELRNDPDIRFVFVGGGLGKQEVDRYIRERGLPNVISLPYQPLERLQYSLSAADVHIVSLGNAFVGMIHPCKIYGAMASARPILFLGPNPSHVTDLLDENNIGWHIQHGDVAGTVATIREIRSSDPRTLAAMGADARGVLRSRFSQAHLCSQFCDAVERAIGVLEADLATQRK
jgi:glycosyltransferase involved in cell wall biosynthesis